MKKKIVSILLTGAMLLLCGCGLISADIKSPGEEQGSISSALEAGKEPDSPKADVPQDPATGEDPEPPKVESEPKAAGKVEGDGFSNPEEAILAYAKALQHGDVQEILSTFAIETYVESYDLAAATENTGAYSVASVPFLPASDIYTAELNRILWQGSITKNLSYLYLSFTDVEFLGQPISFNGDPYDTPEQLVEALTNPDWMQTLSDMEIGAVRTFEDLFGSSDKILTAVENRKQYLGCDELVPLAVEIMLDGQTYYLCTDAASYNGSWYNCNPFGMIAVYLGASLTDGGLCPLED